MADRSEDWFRQAEDTLRRAESQLEDGAHNWACFLAHQASEFAVKAVHLAEGREVWGHTIRVLLQDLGGGVEQDLLERAKVLDGHYVPTRYANGHADGAPFEHYGPYQSEDALGHARAIVDFARARLAEAR